MSQLLALEHIRPPRFRLRDDIGDLTELKASMTERGLIIPITVRTTGEEKWEVVAGHRRYVAAKELGWETIPCDIRDLTDPQAYVLALVENLQRKALTPLEQAQAFKAYIRDYKHGDLVQLAKATGLSPSHINHLLSLLGLPESIFYAVKTGELSAAKGVELARLEKGSVEQSELADIVGKATRLDSKDLGKIVTAVKKGYPITQAVKTVVDFPEWRPETEKEPYEAKPFARRQILAVIEQALSRLDVELPTLEEGSIEYREWIERVRYPLHEIVGAVRELRKKYG